MPDVYSRYPLNNPLAPYFAGNANKGVTVRVNYHNFLDDALRWWEKNNVSKPDNCFYYEDGDKNLELTIQVKEIVSIMILRCLLMKTIYI